MSSVARLYTFTDGTDAYGSQVEADFNVIFNAWNNHDAGTSTWTVVRATSVIPGSITGTTTNDSAATGKIGEYVSSYQTTTDFPATTVVGDLTSISLTAGDWDVSLCVETLANGATVTAVKVGISTTSGNDSTGLTDGDTLVTLVPPDAVNNSGNSIPAVRKSLASTTTVYFKYLATFTVATPRARGRISARRMR